jgi:DoxX-like protein
MTNKNFWIGRTLSGLAAVFLLLDSVMKVVKAAPAVKGTVELGYPESAVIGIGVALLIGTVLYLIPRTAILGAILLTGYLGGAVASQVRVANPLFSHILFPVYVAVFVWLGLFLRDAGLRALVWPRDGATSGVRPVLPDNR